MLNKYFENSVTMTLINAQTRFTYLAICIPGTDSIALVTFQLSQQAGAVVNSFMSKGFISEYLNNSEILLRVSRANSTSFTISVEISVVLFPKLRYGKRQDQNLVIKKCVQFVFRFRYE